MGMTLEEYAAKNGQGNLPDPDREELSATVSAIESERQRAEDAARLKRSILDQLQGGSEVQYILYTALRCIGVLTQDPSFIDQTAAVLSKTYKGIAQRSASLDSVTVKSADLAKKQEDYLDKLRKNTMRKKAELMRLESDVNAVLRELDDLQGRESQEEKENCLPWDDMETGDSFDGARAEQEVLPIEGILKN